MKLYKNFDSMVDITMDHWYYGSKHVSFAIIMEVGETWDEETYQNRINEILNCADPYHTYEEYKIYFRFLCGNEVYTEYVSNQFIDEWIAHR